LPPRQGGGATQDQIAYFSSRGGELAKPDLVTPGVAYSSVPRWNAGDEVKQGTSMASPHAAGLAALLLSAVAPRNSKTDARILKQALMVTARPSPGAGFVDEGQGIPDLEAAYTWLESGRTVPEVEVRLAGGMATAGWVVARPASPGAGGVRSFELIRPASAAPATYQLRSNAAWLSVPAKVTLREADTRIEVRYGGKELSAPGAYSGTIAGWTSDTLAGPAFRVVVTVVVPAPVTAGPVVLRSATRIEAGRILRTFFEADSARPFQVRVSSGARGEQGLAFLHEPRGMPYRDESGRNVASGMQAALYQVDARDAVEGAYEVVAVAAPNQAMAATVSVTQAPVTLHLRREGDRVAGTLANVTPAPVSAEVSMRVGGAERVEAVAARGSSMHRIPFVAPSWATGLVVDIAMDRKQWGRFTDFGVTLFDSLGRQLGKQPLNYAVGRLQVELPERHGDMPVVLGLLPGFADPSGDESWALKVSIRLYADSAVTLAPVGGAPTTLTPAPGKSASATFALPADPRSSSEGFSPLGVLVARIGGQLWTREAGLPAGPGTEP
ncbi:MAG: S8 family serine peptidase, partial [Gemmatimonadales bacterium]